MKEIFENYRENPSEDVWRRLSERLDAEMPVQNTVAGPSRKRSWVWAAAAVAVLMIGGIVFFTMVHHNAGGGDNMAQNKTQQKAVMPSENAADENLAVVETVSENENVVAESSATKESPVVKPMEKDRGAVNGKGVSAPRTELHQTVQPSNLALARQLTEDPVLQTVAPDLVDWSAPTHLSIPNQFTPDDNSANGFFVIDGVENYSSPKLVVQDKNNRVVYQSDDYNNNWDGENCPEGVYSYELTYSYNGIESQASGTVRIIRP